LLTRRVEGACLSTALSVRDTQNLIVSSAQNLADNRD